MNKIIKIILVMVLAVTIIIAAVLAAFVLGLTSDKKEYVTDPIIAHIPLEAHIRFSFDPDDDTLMGITYTLIPSVDVKTDVSEGIVLPEGIIFVENNLPTGQITLRKGKKYKYNAKIKVVKSGRWIFYVSPGVYGDVSLYKNLVTAGVQGVFDATEPLTRYHLREELSKEDQDILMNITKNWLREYGVREYEREEFNCTIISANPDIRCCGCEMMSYSNSILHNKYYFIIDKDRHTNKTKVRNVYRWAYWTPKSYQRKPVCEEIMINNIKI